MLKEVVVDNSEILSHLLPGRNGLTANPEVPGSILGATRFSEYQWVWNGVHPALVRINEELLERKVAAPA
jgi:hypothetical protein